MFKKVILSKQNVDWDSFLNQANFGYQHLSFNMDMRFSPKFQTSVTRRGHCLFGEGINTTPHFEGFWAFLKNTIKKFIIIFLQEI